MLAGLILMTVVICQSAIIMADQPLAPLYDHADHAADVIPGEYIIVLKGEGDNQNKQQLLTGFLRDIQDNIQGSLTVTGSANSLPAVFVKADETAIQQLRAHPSVSFIEANMRVSLID